LAKPIITTHFESGFSFLMITSDSSISNQIFEAFVNIDRLIVMGFLHPVRCPFAPRPKLFNQSPLVCEVADMAMETTEQSETEIEVHQIPHGNFLSF
jgi:hypothetical protein